MLEGFDLHLSKPVSSAELIAAVASIHARIRGSITGR
jgi:CheY-like chemotaxis protein